MITIDETIKDKSKLEQAIQELIEDFERIHEGAKIENIYLNRICSISDNNDVVLVDVQAVI